MANNNITEPFNRHGTSYTSFILVFFLGSFGIAILHALFSLPPTVEFDHLRHILIVLVQSFVVSYAVSVAILILWFILRYKHWVRKGFVVIPVRTWPNSHLQLVLYTDHNGKEKPIHGGHSSLFQIVIFGIGSVAYCISVLAQVESENHVDKFQAARSLLTLTCCTLFIMFVKLYNGVFLKSTRFFYYSISVMLGALVCEWIYIAISPLWKHSAENVTMSTIIGNSSISISDHTEEKNFQLIFDVIHSFLQPFFVEFLSTLTASLFELRKTMESTGVTILHIRWMTMKSNHMY